MSLYKDGINILIVCFVLCRILHYFADSLTLQIISAALLAALMLLSLSKFPKLTKIVLCSLTVTGCALLVYSGADAYTWLLAVLQNGNVVMLLICCPLISAPFYYEDYQGELKTLVQARMRNMLSFLVLVALSTHLLAVIVSVGALLIIYELMKPFALLYDGHEPFLRTASRAYGSSGFWSPAWASVIVYTAYPELQWVKVIPVGIAFAVLFNAINLLGIYIEKKRHPGRYHDIEPEEGAVINKKMLYVMLILAITMIGSIVVFSATTGWDLMLIVSLVSLLFPLVTGLIQRHMREYKSEMKKFYDTSLVKVREQIAIFALAGFLGKALDVVGAGGMIAGVLPEWLKINPALMVFSLMMLMILPSLVGVHPAATGTAIVTALSPAALGLSVYTYCLMIHAGWLLTILITPFSAVALMLSAATGRSNFSLSIGLNWKFVSVCLVVYSVLISVIGPMIG